MDNSKADMMTQQALSLNGILYLPHYQEQNRFVSPGYGLTHWLTFSGIELIALGAKVVNEALWLRGWGKK